MSMQNLFVAKLPRNLGDNDLQQVFATFNPTSAKIMLDATTGKSKGFGFVLFNSEEEGQKAYDALNKTHATLHGHSFNLCIFPSKHDGRVAMETSNALYIRNIPQILKQDKVEEVLRTFGELTYCAMREDHYGNAVWVVYAEFASEETAKKVIEALHNNKTLFDSTIPVLAKYADSEETKKERRRRREESNLLYHQQYLLNQQNQQQQQQNQQQQKQQHEMMLLSQMSPLHSFPINTMYSINHSNITATGSMANTVVGTNLPTATIIPANVNTAAPTMMNLPTTMAMAPIQPLQQEPFPQQSNMHAFTLFTNPTVSAEPSSSSPSQFSFSQSHQYSFEALPTLPPPPPPSIATATTATATATLPMFISSAATIGAPFQQTQLAEGQGYKLDGVYYNNDMANIVLNGNEYANMPVNVNSDMYKGKEDNAYADYTSFASAELPESTFTLVPSLSSSSSMIKTVAAPPPSLSLPTKPSLPTEKNLANPQANVEEQTDGRNYNINNEVNNEMIYSTETSHEQNISASSILDRTATNNQLKEAESNQEHMMPEILPIRTTSSTTTPTTNITATAVADHRLPIYLFSSKQVNIINNGRDISNNDTDNDNGNNIHNNHYNSRYSNDTFSHFNDKANVVADGNNNNNFFYSSVHFTDSDRAETNITATTTTTMNNSNTNNKSVDETHNMNDDSNDNSNSNINYNMIFNLTNSDDNVSPIISPYINAQFPSMSQIVSTTASSYSPQDQHELFELEHPSQRSDGNQERREIHKTHLQELERQHFQHQRESNHHLQFHNSPDQQQNNHFISPQDESCSISNLWCGEVSTPISFSFATEVVREPGMSCINSVTSPSTTSREWMALRRRANGSYRHNPYGPVTPVSNSSLALTEQSIPILPSTKVHCYHHNYTKHNTDHRSESQNNSQRCKHTYKQPELHLEEEEEEENYEEAVLHGNQDDSNSILMEVNTSDETTSQSQSANMHFSDTFQRGKHSDASRSPTTNNLNHFGNHHNLGRHSYIKETMPNRVHEEKTEEHCEE